MALRHEHTRRERIAAAIEKLGALRTRLEKAKTPLRTASELDARVAQILETLFQDWVVVQVFNAQLTPLQRQVLANRRPQQAFTAQKTQ